MKVPMSNTADLGILFIEAGFNLTDNANKKFTPQDLTIMTVLSILR